MNHGRHIDGQDINILVRVFHYALLDVLIRVSASYGLFGLIGVHLYPDTVDSLSLLGSLSQHMLVGDQKKNSPHPAECPVSRKIQFQCLLSFQFERSRGFKFQLKAKPFLSNEIERYVSFRVQTKGPTP